jgi:hypothetical protein
MFRAPCGLHLNMLRQNCCELAPSDRDSLFGAIHYHQTPEEDSIVRWSQNFKETGSVNPLL